MPASDAARQAVEATIRASVTRGERAIALGRLAIGLLALARSVVVWQWAGFGLEHRAALASLAAFGAAGLFLLWELRALRTRDASRALLAFSVFVDTAVCAAALSTNSLWPDSRHPGLLFMPDLAAFVLVASAAGLRLSVGVAAFGGAACLAALGGLVWLDAALFAPLTPAAVQNLSGIAALVLACAVIAGVIAYRTRRIVRNGAERALEAERATRNLGLLLRSHHDVRTLLSSAGLDSDLVLRELEGLGTAADASLLRASRRLRSDLDRVNDSVAEVKQRSHGDLLALEPPERVRPDEVATGVATTLAARFPGVALRVAEGAPPPPVQVAGGAEGLHHVLQLLLVAVCERLAAQRRDVPAVPVAIGFDPETEPGRADGPPSAGVRLEIAVGPAASGAPERDRLGPDLAASPGWEIARRIVEASGGSLALERSAGGGGRVVVALPAGRAPWRLAARRGPLPPEGRRAVEETLAEERARGERLIAAWRLALGVLSIGRSLWVWSAVGWGVAAAPLPLALAAFGSLALFSAGVLLLVRRRAPVALLVGSALLDVALCVVGLSTNVWWPEPGYRGLIFLPELAAFMVPTLVSGLRLSLAASTAALVGSLLGLAGLVAADVAANGPMGEWAFPHLSALVAFIVGVAVVAGITVARTRALVADGAQRALVAERAGRNLDLVFESHQDVRALLASARANAADLARRLESGAVARRARAGELRSLVGQLERDLDAVAAFVDSFRERSYADLLALQSPRPVRVGDTLADVLEQARRRFPDVAFAVAPDVESMRLQVAGGAEGLHHVIHNLVVNACEGDGRRGARRVSLERIPGEDAAGVTLEIADDGPGFPPQWLGQWRGPAGVERTEWPTTKPDGSGLGLGLVRRLVEASQGRLDLANRDRGGARVRISLPPA